LSLLDLKKIYRYLAQICSKLYNLIHIHISFHCVFVHFCLNIEVQYMNVNYRTLGLGLSPATKLNMVVREEFYDVGNC